MSKKPMLSIDGQLNHLKKKGVKFEIMGREAARDYLLNHNNYFKLTAYRKNYDKHPAGENKDRYINLDFAYLVDMAVIDMHLRYCIVHMALDIEHHVKLRLLREVENHSEDGYAIVQDYINSLGKRQRDIFDGEISRNKGNVYCGDIIDKYDGEYPIWAFIEIIPFGRLVAFYGFCADRFMDRNMKDDYYRLLTCKEIRNASAHSNCILNDLHSKTAMHKTNIGVTIALTQIVGMNKNFRKNRMSNARVQQIVTLFYMHKVMVTSSGITLTESKKLHQVMERAYQHIEYYKENKVIKDTFDFLRMVIDNWFSNK